MAEGRDVYVRTVSIGEKAGKDKKPNNIIVTNITIIIIIIIIIYHVFHIK